jgi:hypothetical protein
LKQRNPNLVIYLITAAGDHGLPPLAFGNKAGVLDDRLNPAKIILSDQLTAVAARITNHRWTVEEFLRLPMPPDVA